MNMLYDSESFVVVHFQTELPQSANVVFAPAPPAPSAQTASDSADAQDAPAAPPSPRLAHNGFEIVDKRSGKEIYLDGTWAELFQQQITAWQAKTPTQEEVENTLDSYTVLAHQPVMLH